MVRPRWFVLLLLVAFGCGASSGQSSLFGVGPIVVAPSDPKTTPLEHQMHARLNRDRAGQGLGALAFDAKLADVARAHSKDMNERGFFAHESPRTGTLEDRLDRAGILVGAARENLGEGMTVDSTEDALLKSPGHHANIMSKDVTHIGIGIVKVGSGSSARLLVTQVFAAPIPRQDPAAARAIVARRVAEARQNAKQTALPPHPALEALARKYVGEVADDLDTGASRRIGDKVTHELEGSELSGVSVATSVFITPELYEPGSAVTDRDARAIGIAAAPAKDQRGRPAIKVLLLIGH